MWGHYEARRVCNKFVVNIDGLTESQLLLCVFDDPPQTKEQVSSCVVHHSSTFAHEQSFRSQTRWFSFPCSPFVVNETVAGSNDADAMAQERNRSSA